MKPDEGQTYWQPGQENGASLGAEPTQPVQPAPTPQPVAVEPAAVPPVQPAPPTEPTEPVEPVTPVAPPVIEQEQPLGQDDEQEEVYSEPLTWQASEYVHHDKQTMWYVALVVITLVILAAAIFAKAWTFAVLVIVMGIGIGILAGRPPHTVKYALSDSGLQVDEKHFTYQDFRSFGVIQDGAIYSITLIPSKRFMPAVNVYFPSELGEQIVDTFGSYLAMERIELDLVEKIARKIRF